MRDAGLARFIGTGVIWGSVGGSPANIHYNSGSLANYSNTLFCIVPGNTNAMGISSEPTHVMTDILLYQTLSHVLADTNPSNESLGRAYLDLVPLEKHVHDDF